MSACDRVTWLASTHAPGKNPGNCSQATAIGAELPGSPGVELPSMATINKLSDKTIKAALKKAASEGAARKLSDGAGLVLEARPTGAGWWRLRYWRDGREGMLSLGTYPDTSLQAARAKRDDARALLAEGGDPSEQRKADKAERAAQREAQAYAAAGMPGPGTFEHAAREWHADMTEKHWSPGHSAKVLALMTNDLFPYIGARMLADVTAPELLKQARRIEARGATETAYRALKVAGMVFRHGVQSGYCESDPTRDLKGAVKLPLPEHRAAILEPANVGELLPDFFNGRLPRHARSARCAEVGAAGVPSPWRTAASRVGRVRFGRRDVDHPGRAPEAAQSCKSEEPAARCAAGAASRGDPAGSAPADRWRALCVPEPADR